MKQHYRVLIILFAFVFAVCAQEGELAEPGQLIRKAKADIFSTFGRTTHYFASASTAKDIPRKQAEVSFYFSHNQPEFS